MSQRNGKSTLIKECSVCKRVLKNGEEVSVLISNVEVEGRYIKNREGFRLKISEDGINSRYNQIFCNKCLKIEDHIHESE